MADPSDRAPVAAREVLDAGLAAALPPAAPRRLWLFGWLATFFAFVAVAHGNFETTDAGFTMHAAKNLWERGDSGFRREDQGATSEVEKVATLNLRRGFS